MRQSSRKTFRSVAYVVKPVDGGWVVLTPDDRIVNGAYATQDKAVRAAKAAVQARGGEIRLMGRKGRIVESYTLGRASAGALNALEGISKPAQSRARDSAFDLKGLSPAERRQAIVEAYRSKR